MSLKYFLVRAALALAVIGLSFTLPKPLAIIQGTAGASWLILLMALAARPLPANGQSTVPFQFPPHFFRHVISGSIVFVLGVAADIVVAELFKRAAQAPQMEIVRWQRGEWQTNYTGMAIPATNQNLEIGFSDKGRVFWRTAR